MDSNKKLSEENAELLSDELCNLRDFLTNMGEGVDAVNEYIVAWAQDDDEDDDY